MFDILIERRFFFHDPFGSAVRAKLSVENSNIDGNQRKKRQAPPVLFGCAQYPFEDGGDESVTKPANQSR